MLLNKKLTVIFTGEHPLGFKKVSGVVTGETFENGDETISLKLPTPPTSEKHDLEFSRFKQDCRKRALDTAHYSVPSAVPGRDDLILMEAGKYYNWLISIPEK